MAALECMICTPCGPIRFFSIHLAHIGVGERLEQIDFLLDHHHCSPFEVGPWSGKDDEVHRKWTESETEPECPFAAIWMGDFNSEPGSAEYRRITGEAPYYAGAAYYQSFADAAICAGLPAHALHTHEKLIGGTMQMWQLDHCFVGGML